LRYLPNLWDNHDCAWFGNDAAERHGHYGRAYSELISRVGCALMI
jgi:hypothetical protein